MFDWNDAQRNGFSEVRSRNDKFLQILQALLSIRVSFSKEQLKTILHSYIHNTVEIIFCKLFYPHVTP